MQTSFVDPVELVESLSRTKSQFQVFCSLRDLGDVALPAIRNGLKHKNWHVRHWSAICLKGHCDAKSLRSLLPLLTDPISKVRLWAVHSIYCESRQEIQYPTALKTMKTYR
jgi:hypothetical protein